MFRSVDESSIFFKLLEWPFFLVSDMTVFMIMLCISSLVKVDDDDGDGEEGDDDDEEGGDDDDDDEEGGSGGDDDDDDEEEEGDDDDDDDEEGDDDDDDDGALDNNGSKVGEERMGVEGSTGGKNESMMGIGEEDDGS
jgi:hypothetical protein